MVVWTDNQGRVWIQVVEKVGMMLSSPPIFEPPPPTGGTSVQAPAQQAANEEYEYRKVA